MRVRIYRKSKLKRTMWVHGWSNREYGTNKVKFRCKYRRGTYSVRMRAFYYPEDIRSHTVRLYFKIK